MFSNLPRIVDQHERGTERMELGDDVEAGAKLKNARKAEAKMRKFEADAKKGGGSQGAAQALDTKVVWNPKRQKGAKGKGKDKGAGKGKGDFPEGINLQTSEG